MSQDSPDTRDSVPLAATDGTVNQAGRYGDFSLRSVMWGYRDIFQRTIEDLFDHGRLGPGRREVTAKFFTLLKRADQGCFDHVLRQFLGALHPANRWIMDLPGLFADLVDLGGAVAAGKAHNGIRLFEILAAGGMGRSPAQLRECIDHVRRLREIDEGLAMAFLDGHDRLQRRLRPVEMDRYIDVALRIHQDNPQTAYEFFRGELATSETYILTITKECRIADVVDPLRAMLKALTGRDCKVADLSRLDSDDLIERGATVVTAAGHLYLPGRIRRFDIAGANRNWYLLCGVTAAAMLLGGSFPHVHGRPGYRTCAALTGGAIWRTNLFQVVEFTRVLRLARRRWPGARRLLAWAMQTELADAADDSPERCLADALDKTVERPALDRLRQTADDCVNCFDTADRLDESWSAEVLSAYPALARRPLEPSGFLSDFLFPMTFSESPSDRIVGDLKDAARDRRKGEGETPPAAARSTVADGDGDGVANEQADADAIEAAFVYDEWDFHQNDYRPGWCLLRQKAVEPAAFARPRSNWLDDARKVHSIFERLKPDLARREKRLADGDDINADLLIAYLVDRTREPAPPARFYEKPLVHHRDLAVLILLDVSGSTGEPAGGATKVLDVEKHAAVLLGQGLSTLGDRFAVCGFSSNGREDCEFLLFKDFDDNWTDAIARVMAALPRSSTRIGPALRHAGALLADQPARQRLIILVTDGKPMDQGYDPKTRYAQHDVRMACEENARREIHTFAISTGANTRADMEIMFPRRRFTILSDIRQLPRVLPHLYLRLTL